MLATATPEAPKSVLATHAKPAVIMLQLQLPSGTRLGIGQAGRGAYVCKSQTPQTLKLQYETPLRSPVSLGV